MIGGLTQTVNSFLKLAGENSRMQPRKVGAVLTSLGFSSRTRTNSGWVLSLNRRDAERLHQVAAIHGIDGMKGRFLRVSSADCELCRAVGFDKKEPPLTEGTTRMQVDLCKEPQTRVHR